MPRDFKSFAEENKNIINENQSKANDYQEILDKYTSDQIRELRYDIAKVATQAKINNKPILPTCKELVEIAYYALKTQGDNEEQFLEPLISMLKKGKCPADI